MSEQTKPRRLVEGVDFYREGPYMVFTEEFLRRRGWCCESGCRHCPWGYRERGIGDRVPDGGADSK